MKIQVTEHNDSFLFNLEAETLEDAAFLTRFGLNRTKQLRYAEADAWENGKFSGDICFGKNKKFSSTIKRKNDH